MLADPGPPSKDLLNLAPDLGRIGGGVILDAGCGYGRNAIALAAHGLSVVCVDQDFNRLTVLTALAASHVARASQCQPGSVWPLQTKFEQSRWPFKPNCFSGIACVHFLDVALFQAFRSSLMEGGYQKPFGDFCPQIA
jgi:SAM-dependent methyltransferase